MANSLPVQVDGTTILIEVEPTVRTGSQQTSAGIDKALDSVNDAFEKAKQTIVTVAKSMVGAINGMEKEYAPDGFDLEFGLKFTAEGQVFLAKVSGDASLNVKLNYKPKPANIPAETTVHG